MATSLQRAAKLREFGEALQLVRPPHGGRDVHRGGEQAQAGGMGPENTAVVARTAYGEQEVELNHGLLGEWTVPIAELERKLVEVRERRTWL